MNIFTYLIEMKLEELVGIFFDYKKEDFEKDFKFVRDVGVTFQMIFNDIIKRKIKKKWTLKDKEMQYIKRGRYTEFNLLYDRGTKFGLQTGGNVEVPSPYSTISSESGADILILFPYMYLL